MTDDRFNELLAGPLHHPMAPLAITRLALALRVVVEETGEAGEKALENYCQSRERQDNAEPDEFDGEMSDACADGIHTKCDDMTDDGTVCRCGCHD